MRSWLTSVGLLMACALAGGCSSYALRGTVVSGPTPAVLVVDADDPRLQEQGIPGAAIEVMVDPETVRPVRLGPAAADDEGRFDIPLEQFGAGFLEYRAMLTCTARGYRHVVHSMKLPPARRRLLIIMAEGADRPLPRRDLLEDTMRLGTELMK